MIVRRIGILGRLAPACIAILLSAAVPAAANDGYAGLSAGGLEFRDTDDIEMLSEDLFLSQDEVRVTYVFRNVSDRDVEGYIAFPIPSISFDREQYGDFPLDDAELSKPNFMEFRTKVDGEPVTAEMEYRAFLPDLASGMPPGDRERIDGPGEDVTAILTANKIPISFNYAEVQAALAKLSAGKLAALQQKGLLDVDAAGVHMPHWQVAVRYYWKQTFAAGQQIAIEHVYKPIPSGWIFYLPEKGSEGDDFPRKTYCLDDGTEAAIRRLEARGGNGLDGAATLTAYGIDYILMTANSWKGPIGTFRLTIDKGLADNVVSLCLDGDIRKTAPTTFVAERTNFTPTADLRVMIVQRPSDQ